jgi:hypothetical protein
VSGAARALAHTDTRIDAQATELRDLRTAEFSKAAEFEKRLRLATEGKHELERALRRKEAELERILAGRYVRFLRAPRASDASACGRCRE